MGCGIFSINTSPQLTYLDGPKEHMTSFPKTNATIDIAFIHTYTNNEHKHKYKS